MGRPAFKKVGDLKTVLDNENPELALKKILEEAQIVNSDFATETLRDLHTEPQFSLVDVVLTTEDGRVSKMWPTINSYLGYPETKHPPKINELLEICKQQGKLLYPFTSRHYTIVFCREENYKAVTELAGKDIESFHYGDNQSKLGFDPGPEYEMLFVPDGVLVPSKTKSRKLALGNFGFWAISERFMKPDNGDPDKVVAYKPRVYLSHGQHPGHSKSVYITPNPRAATIATGHLPMDERSDSLRVVIDLSESDVIKGIFIGYNKDERVSGFPLVLKYRPYTAWTGFYPKHGDSNQ